MSKTFTIWSNASLPDNALALLQEGTKNHRLIFSDTVLTNLQFGGPCEALEGVDIAFGQPDAPQVAAQENLKWVHVSSAGYTRYDTPECRSAFRARGAVLTNSSSVYDEPCAQHVLAFLLAYCRSLPHALEDQLGPSKWSINHLRPVTRILRKQTVVILGYGAIAERLVRMLTPFDLTVIGVRRTIRGNEPIPMITIDKVDEVLPDADFIVNILPASPSTNGFFNQRRLSILKPEALLMNIGRGTTIDQEALMAALKAETLGGAYLDVTDPEPLPSNHPLWSTPNCYVTPHIAGGFRHEHMRLVEHFLDNLRRFEQGQPLLDHVF